MPRHHFQEKPGVIAETFGSLILERLYITMSNEQRGDAETNQKTTTKAMSNWVIDTNCL